MKLRVSVPPKGRAMTIVPRMPKTTSFASNTLLQRKLRKLLPEVSPESAEKGTVNVKFEEG